MNNNALATVIGSLGKGEVDSSILSGSTIENADESRTFSDFLRERSRTAKIQRNPERSSNVRI